MNEVLFEQIEELQSINSILISTCHSQKKTIKKMGIIIIMLTIILITLLGIIMYYELR